MWFAARPQADIPRDTGLREELIRTELPKIVDRVLALEQEREMHARRDLRVYLGGLEHLDLRSRVLTSERIASACAREYDSLVAAEAARRDACLRIQPSVEEQVPHPGVFRVRLAGVAGLVATTVLMQPLAWLGLVPVAAALLVSIALCGAGELFTPPRRPSRKLVDAWWYLWAEDFRFFDSAVREVCARWRHTMAEQHVRPLVREFLERALREPSKLREVTAPGLRHARDTAYLAHTKPVEQFLLATQRVGDGVIGIAGARGSGKSLLIESYLAGRLSGGEPGHRLSVRVSAPVHYEPRDFVVYLYDTVCRAVLALTGPGDGDQWAGLVRRERVHRWVTKALRNLLVVGLAMGSVAGLAAVTTGVGPLVSYWPAWGVAPLLVAVALALGGGPGPLRLVKAVLRGRGRHSVEISALRRLAGRRLTEIQFLRTATSGWTGNLPLRMGWTRTTQRAERPLTHPEIVARFREFLEITARVLGRTSRQTPRVLVGVDELDKIESAEQAQAFLNEIKDVFGIPGCQFLVSVSEDALAAFERRGIPVRDTFDSAFDRIIQVSHIDFADACLLLQQRIPTMPWLFKALCHCMSGGVPRDLVRVAGAMVDKAVDLGDKEATLGDMCAALVAAELTHKAHAFQRAASQLGSEFDTSSFAWKLGGLPGEPASGWLLDLAADLAPTPGAVDAFTILQQETASFVYYCATLLDMFAHKPEDELILHAPASPDHSASFDALATVRQKLAVDPRLAWLTLDEFRRAWGLPLP